MADEEDRVRDPMLEAVDNEEELSLEAEDAEPEEEFAIEIDGEENAGDEPPLVKHLRDQLRERDKRLSTYERATLPKIEVGPKPTMEDPDIDYDSDKFEIELDAWKERKRQADAQEADARRAAETRAAEDQKLLISYRASAAALQMPNFEEAEAAVLAALPDAPDRPLHMALLKYTKEPAKIVAALHKYPAKLQEIVAEPDIIKVILKLNELEGKLKVTNRRKPPPPEADTVQRGSAATSQKVDKALEVLEREADRTGDRSKIAAYRRAQKQPA